MCSVHVQERTVHTDFHFHKKVQLYILLQVYGTVQLSSTRVTSIFSYHVALAVDMGALQKMSRNRSCQTVGSIKTGRTHCLPCS